MGKYLIHFKERSIKDLTPSCNGVSPKYEGFNIDELVKSRKTPFFVIPAKAGIQFFSISCRVSGLRFSPE
jgi:hypothetical protein